MKRPAREEIKDYILDKRTGRKVYVGHTLAKIINLSQRGILYFGVIAAFLYLFKQEKLMYPVFYAAIASFVIYVCAGLYAYFKYGRVQEKDNHK